MVKIWAMTLFWIGHFCEALSRFVSGLRGRRRSDGTLEPCSCYCQPVVHHDPTQFSEPNTTQYAAYCSTLWLMYTRTCMHGRGGVSLVVLLVACFAEPYPDTSEPCLLALRCVCPSIHTPMACDRVLFGAWWLCACRPYLGEHASTAVGAEHTIATSVCKFATLFLAVALPSVVGQSSPTFSKVPEWECPRELFLRSVCHHCQQTLSERKPDSLPCSLFGGVGCTTPAGEDTGCHMCCLGSLQQAAAAPSLCSSFFGCCQGSPRSHPPSFNPIRKGGGLAEHLAWPASPWIVLPCVVVLHTREGRLLSRWCMLIRRFSFC